MGVREDKVFLSLSEDGSVELRITCSESMQTTRKRADSK